MAVQVINKNFLNTLINKNRIHIKICFSLGVFFSYPLLVHMPMNYATTGDVWLKLLRSYMILEMFAQKCSIMLIAK